MRILLTLLCLIEIAYAGLFNPIQFRLPNGLHVVAINNPSTMSISVGVVYKVGCADDPQGQIGLSHFLEHMMFRGTTALPGDGYKKLMQRLGAEVNAHTSHDVTVYTNEINPRDLETVLKVEADRMRNLTFTSKDFEAERLVVLEERQMRLAGSILREVADVAGRAAFWRHPYGTPTIGWDDDIKAYDRVTMKRHYDRFYRPNNAVLVLVGNLGRTPAQLQATIQKHFGKVPRGADVVRIRPAEPPHGDTTIRLHMKSGRLANRKLAILYAAPTHRPDPAKFFATWAMGEAIGDGELGLLRTRLVNEQQAVQAIDVDYEGPRFDPTVISLDVDLLPGQDFAEAEALVLDAMTQIQKEGIPEMYITQAKQDLLKGTLFKMDGNGPSFNTFAQLGIGFDVETLDRWPDLIKAVTPTAVNASLRDIFSKKPLVVIELDPKPGADGPLEIEQTADHD